MKGNNINLLVQKLLVSDWDKMNFELFRQLVTRTRKQLEEIFDAADKLEKIKNKSKN